VAESAAREPVLTSTRRREYSLGGVQRLRPNLLSIIRRRGNVVRRVALACCLAAAASVLGGQIHSVAVRHVECAAHGELQDAPTVVAVADAERREPGVEAAEHEVSDGHEHCLVAVALRRLASQKKVPPSVALLAPPEVRRPVQAVLPRPVTTGRTVLLAPKTSPPSA
jgi:hypothetical protein